MAKTRKDYEGNIRQRPDGRWEVRVTLGNDFATGESKRISRYASSQDEAVKLLHELSFLRDTVPKSFQSIKLGEWLTFCLEVYMKPSIKQSTYSSYEAYIRVHLKPYLGELELKDLSPRTLQQFYNYKSEAEGLSPKTIININLFLHKALAYAVTEGYISSNPAAGVNLPRGKKPQIQILTRDEQARLDAMAAISIATAYLFVSFYLPGFVWENCLACAGKTWMQHPAFYMLDGR